MHKMHWSVKKCYMFDL